MQGIYIDAYGGREGYMEWFGLVGIVCRFGGTGSSFRSTLPEDAIVVSR